jgi:hypothetical protein
MGDKSNQRRNLHRYRNNVHQRASGGDRKTQRRIKQEKP